MTGDGHTSGSSGDVPEDAVVVSPTTGDAWEVVVGLEVHAELATATKLFSGAPNAFGGEPNRNIDPVSLGLPGTLPVLNRQAVELAMRVGLALGCEVRPCTFARKNYFYPDMPKDFQISQYDEPLNANGSLELPSGRVIGIERAHLEEDTGKNTHVGGDGRIHGAQYSLIDYNRAGVPLIEIVGRPEVRGAAEARAYVAELRSILVAVGASDGKMEEGSLRVDANVSVRPVGSTALGDRCEIKNVNSLRSLGRAIEFEARRQVDLLESGERVAMETRHWDDANGVTRPGRSKEQAEDYRYFPEPDLVPLDPDEAWVDAVRAALPPLPAERRRRLADAAGVTAAEVALHVERDLDSLALGAIAAGATPARVLNHVEHNLAVDGAHDLDPAHLAEVVTLEVDGELTATQAKAVLADVVASGRSPREVAAERGFEAMDAGALEAVLDAVIAEHPGDWDDFVATDDPKKRKKLTGFFTGKVMAATSGAADGRAVGEALARRSASSAGD